MRTFYYTSGLICFAVGLVLMFAVDGGYATQGFGMLLAITGGILCSRGRTYPDP
jgi:hypothetical protein